MPKGVSVTDRNVLHLQRLPGRAGPDDARGEPGPRESTLRGSRERGGAESRKSARLVLHLAAMARLTRDAAERPQLRLGSEELAALYEATPAREGLQRGEEIETVLRRVRSEQTAAETAARPLTCVVADDHPIVREAIVRVLECSEISVVGYARTGEEALREIELKRPRVALVDLRLPLVHGIEVARQASRRVPETGVILYTGADPLLLSSAWEGGARGFVLKEAPVGDLARAVKMVADGHVYIDPALAGFLVRSSAARNLDRRDFEVLRLLADGLTTEAIAGRLMLSPDGVRSEVRRMMVKLNVHSRTEAVASAIRQRLIA